MGARGSMHHIVTRLYYSPSLGRLVCNGPNCSPEEWLAASHLPPKRWHLLRMEGSFDLRRRHSMVMTRYINELIYRIRRRQRCRAERRWAEAALAPHLPADCVLAVAEWLAPARWWRRRAGLRRRGS